MSLRKTEPEELDGVVGQGSCARNLLSMRGSFHIGRG